MTSRFKPPIIPAAFFGIVLGLAGLGNAWRAAHLVWRAPTFVGEALMALAAIVWALLLLLFILKWIFAREEALGEAHHPVQCCFIGLAGVATMLIALAALPYSRAVAEILFGIGAAFTLAFALWRTGLLWRGEREHSATTPVLYLPTVAWRGRHGDDGVLPRPSRLGAACVRRRLVLAARHRVRAAPSALHGDESANGAAADLGDSARSADGRCRRLP
jgi:hypothetical protein